jgi:uncharacterized protein (TIGR02588 family)
VTTSRPSRTTAEWVSLAGAAAVVLLLVGLIVAQIPGSDRPAAPEARVDGVRQAADTFHVDVTVDNRGERSATNVQISAELTIGVDTVTGDQTIDFLSGGEQQRLTFVFTQDPASGDLQVAVTGFGVP